MATTYPFPSVDHLAAECGEEWNSFRKAASATQEKERILKDVLLAEQSNGRLLDTDSSLVLCGSFARYEMDVGSDCDWTLLINGVVNNQHADTARIIHRAILRAQKEGKGILLPGSSGTFGNLAFSHDLVHLIGGGADSNENLTRRILLLLESRPLSLSNADSSAQVWEAVLHSILERYFEEEVHFSPLRKRKVPRFLLNDLTRYWRTITVDYAAKHREQDGRKWAIRNAKLRFSRKLLYAAGLAFCFDCELSPPASADPEYTSNDFIEFAMNFAKTSPLEYLAAFVQSHVSDQRKRANVSKWIFGTYHEWLDFIGDKSNRDALTELLPCDAAENASFQRVRILSKDFSKGLRLLFFNKIEDADRIANLSLDYVGF